MPELPEAETIARYLDRRLAGLRIKRVVHLRSDMVRDRRGRSLRREVAGAIVRSARRRGKRVIVELDRGRCLVFALGMTGHPHIVESASPPAPHVHLRLALSDDGYELRLRDARRFGWIEWLSDGAGLDASMANLGVEPLDMTLAQFRRVISRSRQIKALLMDQSVIAGMGNIYCDEALHRCGIHPHRIAAELDADQVACLCRTIKRVLRAAIRANGSTINSYLHPDGGPGSYQDQHWVYGREGLACRTCGTPIVRMLAAGRSSHVCNLCQPLPA